MPESETPPQATRRRGAELEDALLSAAWEILVADGYSGFTFDAIAAKAQTSRAVLYRRWPQRSDLLKDTLRHNWVPLQIPDTGDLRTDALQLLRTIAEERSDLTSVFTIQLADYFRESGTRIDDLRHVIGTTEREAPFATIARRAIRRGEIPDVPHSERILNLPMDLMRHDMLTDSVSATDASLTQIVDEAWLPLLRAAAPSEASPPAS